MLFIWNKKQKVILSTSTSTSFDIQTALNDLPTLSPNLITCVNVTINGNDKIFTVTFSAQIGLNLFYVLCNLINSNRILCHVRYIGHFCHHNWTLEIVYMLKVELLYMVENDFLKEFLTGRIFNINQLIWFFKNSFKICFFKFCYSILLNSMENNGLWRYLSWENYSENKL